MVPNPEYDKPGYCAYCHKAIAEFDGANNIVRLLGDAAEAWFTLDDLSRMRVMLCQSCKDGLKPSDTPKLMESVYKGWVFECDTLVEKKAWSEEKRNNHLGKYGDRHIVARNDVPWNKATIEKAVGKKNMKGANPNKPLSAQVMGAGI